MHCKKCFSPHLRQSRRWGYLPLWFITKLARCSDCWALFRVPFWVRLDPPQHGGLRRSTEFEVPAEFRRVDPASDSSMGVSTTDRTSDASISAERETLAH
ncbi:hypothetical protein [Schlesneria paludicola]|uniref:hypothetical protein n=1 Tax=Schlesneria paludicola TaxID=360056 RepID=UPI00029B3C8A|nr:hypothetical protein [Schlesneria paludicola]